ncbi:MAG: hypothetical protein WBB08_06090 [Halobacteriota archaeon]
MRGKVAVAVIVVLACALFLVPYASAKVEISCSVYPEKAGYDTDFVYSITLTNTGSFITLGELKLIVGSDSDITREWVLSDMTLEPGSPCEIEYGKIRIPAGKSCTVKMRVQFKHHKLYQGEFKEWADAEKPDLPEWDKAWYEWFFIDMRSEKVSCDGSGKPILTLPPKVIFQELPPVEQNEVYKGLSFDYDVQVWANCEDRIELQVRNYSKTSSDGWDKHGLKEYTGLDLYTNKTFTWYAVNLTRDNFRNGQGLYKFVGNISESQPYTGPKIEERFDDPRVSYKKTINELLLFDYEVTAWVNWVKDSIMLEVYNYTLHDWEEKGIRNYATPGKNQKLRWESIILSSDYFDDDHRGKYRFVGSYNKNKLEIIDPTIEEKFYPLDVAPTQGTNTDTFNYSVTVNANICDKIELQVKNHTINNKWDSKGTRDYVTPNINKTLTWNNIKLNTHELDQFNDSMFRFNGTKVGINSSTSTGPFYPLDLSWRNPSVTPNEGLYLYDSKFDYCIEVKSTKEIEVKLRVFYPHKGEAVIADNTKSYTRGDRGNWKLICWNDTQPFVEEDEGDASYKFEFYYTGTKINETERSGPSIGIAIFNDASLEPEIGTRETEFTFSVWVKAVKPDYLTLKVYDSNRDCVAERKSKDRTTTEWKQIVFENVSFKVPPALGNASHEYLTGKDTKISFDGPEIIEEEFGELFVSPEEGTNYTTFDFSVEYKTSKPEYVTLWAKCDDGNWEAVERKQVVSEQSTILFSAETPCEAFEAVCWNCTGIVSESGINCTNWDIGLKWQNRSLSPKEGWWYETFDFSVSLSANVPGEVVLMVKKEDSNEWMAVGKNRPYTGSPNRNYSRFRSQ